MRFTRVLRNIGAQYSAARSVLRVEAGATKKEVHSAYLKMAKEYHPDTSTALGRDPKEVETKFQEIGEAYQLLIATKAPKSTSQSDASDLQYGHELNDEGYPLVADIAYAKEILGVEPDSTKEEVEKMYVQLSLVYHPDIGEAAMADPEYFRTLTEAYKTFMNQEVISTGQVMYVDVINDLDWSVAARQRLHRGRTHGKEDTFYGFSPEEMKPSSTWEKLKGYSFDGVRHSVRKMATFRGAIPARSSNIFDSAESARKTDQEKTDERKEKLFY